jgi:copper(I)-binding protein
VGEVTVLNPMSRAVPMPGGNGAAFMTIQNGTDAALQLIAAETDIADVVELHETVQEGDVMRMIPRPEGFEIPPGGTLELKPGGKHVMLLGVPEPPAVGESFALTLRFADGAAIELSVPVMEMGATMGGMEGN